MRAELMARNITRFCSAATTTTLTPTCIPL
jgi:hypothetical protein